MSRGGFPMDAHGRPAPVIPASSDYPAYLPVHIRISTPIDDCLLKSHSEFMFLFGVSIPIIAASRSSGDHFGLC